MAINKQLRQLVAQTEDVTPAAQRQVKPDLSAPPMTGVGLTTERIGLLQQNEKLRAEAEALRLKITQLEENNVTVDVALDLLDPNPWQPRRHLNVATLAESIKLVGVLQPLLVRPHPAAPGRFQILAGERRMRAALLAELSAVPVRVMTLDDADMAILALTENIDREDLSDYEISKSLLGIQQRYPEKKQLAEAIGLDRRSLYRFLAFQQLPSFIQADLEDAPGLMGATLADELTAYLKKQNLEDVEPRLIDCWGRLKDGKLSQRDFLLQLQQTPRGQRQGAQQQAMVLMAGGLKAGTIKKDHRNLVITLKASVLSASQEQKIRAMLEKLFD